MHGETDVLRDKKELKKINEKTSSDVCWFECHFIYLFFFAVKTHGSNFEKPNSSREFLGAKWDLLYFILLLCLFNVVIILHIFCNFTSIAQNVSMQSDYSIVHNRFKVYSNSPRKTGIAALATRQQVQDDSEQCQTIAHIVSRFLQLMLLHAVVIGNRV